MEIGKRIREIRTQKEMTQAELADKSGVALITLSQYERGKRQPRLERLTEIAKALNVPIGELMGYEDMGGEVCERETSDKPTHKRTLDLQRFAADSQQSSVKARLDEAFNKLNPAGQQVAAERVEELSQIPAYQKDKD